MKKLKKFLITGAAVITMAASLSGCCNTTTDQNSAKEISDRFVETYFQSNGLYGDVRIVVDRETGVAYLINDIANGGGLTVMVDENGKPLIWEGEME